MSLCVCLPDLPASSAFVFFSPCNAFILFSKTHKKSSQSSLWDFTVKYTRQLCVVWLTENFCSVNISECKLWQREGKKEYGDLWTKAGSLPLRSVIGGVQWRAQHALNPLPTKWSTVYLRGQIGQTVSNYPPIESKDFLLLPFFSPFLSCVWESSIVPTHQPAVSADLVLLWTQGALVGTGFTHCLLWACRQTDGRTDRPGRKHIHSEKSFTFSHP